MKFNIIRKFDLKHDLHIDMTFKYAIFISFAKSNRNFKASNVIVCVGVRVCVCANNICRLRYTL